MKKSSIEQINYIRNNYRFHGSFDYKMLGCNISVEQHIKEVWLYQGI